VSEILIGVDRSDHSRRAVEFAVARAAERHDSVVLTHVIPWSPFSFNTATENEHRHKQKAAELTAATTQVIDPLAGIVREAGVPVEVIVRHGDPVDMLIEIAQDRGSDHIVLGRTGDSRVRQALFGSLPAQMVQVAPVPVTVVP
jgi:nucleotide-binding universal stress UspA family protein